MSSLQDEILKVLHKIEGKFLIPRGTPIWGSINRVAKNDYRILLLDDDGKLVQS